MAGVSLEQETGFVLETFIGHWQARGKIRPTVPRPGFDCPKYVRSAPDRSAASLVITVVGDVEFSRIAKRHAERIAETPSHQFDGTALGFDAHDRTAARQLPFNYL